MNPALLADAASAALDANDLDLATSLLDRAAAEAPLSPQARNLRALIAMRQDRFADAISDLGSLLDGDASPALRFNLAWAHSCMGQFDQADRYLDDETLAASPRAPSLKIHALHHLERYDEALDLGASLAERYPHDEALMGALATLAMDADREDLARDFAQRAGDSAEGLAARGMFALEDQEFADAQVIFGRALDRQPNNPRAWVGKGLALLSNSDAPAAAQALDHGAALFGDHLGSWVAAGWAFFVAGDIANARERFDRVVALDPTFSEGHGGLAVVDILSGNFPAAKRNCELATRLDRSSMSGALAASLLQEAEGNPAAAERIRERAMNAPIGPSGKTLAQILASSATGFLKS